LSGIGEASFQCLVPPYIDDHSPPKHKALWLATFFTAVPVGASIGYGYGASLASTLGWQWAFWLEVLPMAPFVVYCLLRTEDVKQAELGERILEPDMQSPDSGLVEGDWDTSKVEAMEVESKLLGLSQRSIASSSSLQSIDVLLTNQHGDEDVKHGVNETPSFFDELVLVLRSPVYLVVVLGQAAYTVSLPTLHLRSFRPSLVASRSQFSHNFFIT
jgi:MFS family permease